MRLRNLLVAAVRVLLGSAPIHSGRDTVRRLRSRLDYVRATAVPPTGNLSARFGEDDLMVFVRCALDDFARTPCEGIDPTSHCHTRTTHVADTTGAEAVLADIGLAALPESLPP